jgi:hypothetical protein
MPAKKSNKSKKTQVRIRDLRAKKDAKGGRKAGGDPNTSGK